MDEILELQRRLADIQSTSTLSRLSDRVIVDLIQVLLQQDPSFTLIYTKDGQEYLTPEALDNEIREIVQLKKKINVDQLPDLINVNLEKIESRLNNGFNEISKVGNSLVTQEYIDDVCQEVNEELQQRMKMDIVDVAGKAGLPVGFIKNMIQERLGSIIQGTLISGGQQLTTLSFMQIQLSKLRGLLRASIRPLSLSTVSKDYEIPENLIFNLIDELLKKEEIDGKVQGGMYIPTRFLKNQELIVKNFFNQNDYIEYDLMSKQLMITKPKDYLKNLFKDNCIFLDSCCFNKDSLLKIKEQILSLLNFGWADLSTSLPTILTPGDIDAIVFKHLSLGEAAELEESFIFDTKFLEKCGDLFTDKIKEFIYKTPQKLVENNKSSNNGKGRKGKKGWAGDDEDDEGRKERIFGKEEIVKFLIEKGVLEHSDQDVLFEEALYKQVCPKIAVRYNNIKKDLFESKKSGSTEIIQELQKKIEDLLFALQYSSKSITTLESTISTIPTSIFYELTLTSSRYLLELLIIYLCKKIGINLSPSYFSESKPKPTDSIENVMLNSLDPAYLIFKNFEMVSSAIENFPKDNLKLLKELLGFLMKKKNTEFLDFFLKNLDNFGLKSSLVLDKKSEKNFLHLQRYFAKEGLKQNRQDVKMTLFFVLMLCLLEENLFFIVNQNNMNISLLLQISEEMSKEEKKSLIQEGKEAFEGMVAGEVEKGEGYYEAVKRLEGMVESLEKTVKF